MYAISCQTKRRDRAGKLSGDVTSDVWGAAVGAMGRSVGRSGVNLGACMRIDWRIGIG